MVDYFTARVMKPIERQTLELQMLLKLRDEKSKQTVQPLFPFLWRTNLNEPMLWVFCEWQTGPQACTNTHDDDIVIHHQSDPPNKTTVEDLFHHRALCCCLTSAHEKRNKHLNICQHTRLLLRVFLMSRYVRQPAEHSESKRRRWIISQLSGGMCTDANGLPALIM